MWAVGVADKVLYQLYLRAIYINLHAKFDVSSFNGL